MVNRERANIDTARRWLVYILEAVATVSFVVMCTSVILQVMFRYVLQIVAPWTEELARFACIWTVFLGAAVCFDEQTHIKIDFLATKLTGKAVRRLLLLFNIFVMSTFILSAFYGSMQLLRVGWEDTATTIPIQMGLVYLALPISLGAIAILGALRFFAAGGRRQDRTELTG